MRRFPCTAAVLAVLALTGRAPAGVDADPSKDYFITPDVGPFTICAASESGDAARKLAHDLVLEIRARYGLPAFVYNRGAELRRQQEAELQRKRQQQREYLERMGLHPDSPLRLPRVRIEEQFAVLIGGYPDMESARKELNRIKKLQPPKSVPHDVVTLERTDAPAAGKKPWSQRTEVNPFATSFVVPNPTVPPPREQAQKPDPFWKQLNAGETYSLLNCPKPWTMVIKEFQGVTVIEPASAPTKIMNLLKGKGTADQLNASALNAHNLAEALRKLGLEAYVLHTRGSSIVTIGGFDRQDDPRMAQVQRHLFSSALFGPNVDIMARPMPMAVPRF